MSFKKQFRSINNVCKANCCQSEPTPHSWQTLLFVLRALAAARRNKPGVEGCCRLDSAGKDFLKSSSTATTGRNGAWPVIDNHHRIMRPFWERDGEGKLRIEHEPHLLSNLAADNRYRKIFYAASVTTSVVVRSSRPRWFFPFNEILVGTPRDGKDEFVSISV